MERPYIEILRWMMTKDGGIANTNEKSPVCVAFVSEYTDCNQENKCDGCTKCVCTADGQWSCRSIQECDEEDVYIDEKTFDSAVAKMDRDLRYESMMKKQEPRISDHLVPQPGEIKADSDELAAMTNYDDPISKLQQLIRRPRSVSAKNNQNTHEKTKEKMNNKRITRNSEKHNHTIKFYSTVDELNEDTLKYSNISGTLQAKKVELNSIPDITRRANTIENKNKSLHIDFNQPIAFNHITDNKIDTTDPVTKFDSSHENLNSILGNQTQNIKNGELSKLVVNELKPGTEVVGDKNAPVTSNITFTSENDTLTAMAYIAGNLLNKLWNIEKDTSGALLATDEMKQEKISDLLDLFKEPLNLRQEAFLKKALEKLSSTIDKDKDIKNVTICETIAEATSLIDNFHNTYVDETSSEDVKDHVPCENDKEDQINKIHNQATLKAIAKINNVLGLMRKFESIQRNLSTIKNESNSNIEIVNNMTAPIRKKLVENSLTKDEANSLNTFGNILDKITKFLLPKKGIKKTRQLIRNKHILSDSINKDSDILKMFNIDLSNATLTAKDRIILDYLTHIKNRPDCALNKYHHKTDEKSLPTVESNILLNLSEFYKIKSFTDLVNLIQPSKTKTEVTSEIKKKSMLRTDTEPSTNAPESTTMSITTTTEQSQKFASTKEKLKAHLKSIIEDLIELQNAKGIAPRGNIRIADALPCIYSIMNAGKDMYKDLNKESNPPASLVDIFNDLKDDMKKIKTRRTDSIMKVRPKSVVVLERMIKNFGQKQNPKTRRSGSLTVIDDLKKSINKIQNISSLYKNQALYIEVPAAERLVLLKALEADIKHNVAALEGIKIIFKNVTHLSSDQLKDISTFVISAAKNISLDEKVIDKLEKNSKTGTNKYVPGNLNTGAELSRLIAPTKPLAMFSGGIKHDDNLKITRNQIISHLIRNKMKMYMNLKEARELDVNNDINYNIAKRVIFYLDSGNVSLAHELFKVLMAQKDDDSHLNDSSDIDSIIANTPRRRNTAPRLKPLIQFEEPKSFEKDQSKWMNNDHLIKQLLNNKNLQA